MKMSEHDLNTYRTMNITMKRLTVAALTYRSQTELVSIIDS